MAVRNLLADLPGAASRARLAVPTLQNKTCIVTGGSQGIGAAIASRFASEGAHVTIVGRKPETLKQACAEINVFRTSKDQKISTFEGDVRQDETWSELLKFVPGPDVLVNCAGVSQAQLLSRMSEDDTKKILDTNLHSAITGSRHAIRSMMKKKVHGCIINVSSLLATRGSRGTSVYAASKAGLLGLTSSLAVEYGRYSIRVNALVPGYIDTEMTNALQNLPDEVKRIPLRRLGTVYEVADAALFLAANPYANNCILNLDGGLSAA